MAKAKKDVAPVERVAKDGTKRGLNRGKNRATQLLEEMQEQIQMRYDIVDFDPVVMLAMIGVEAMDARPVVDHKGRPLYLTEKNEEGEDVPILDDDGDRIPLMNPADVGVAISAFSKAAPYVRSTLKQIEISEAGDDPIDADIIGAKQRMISMVKRDEDE